MLKEFLEKIEKMCQPNTISIEGVMYSDKQLSPVLPYEPSVKDVVVSSLTSIVEYLVFNPDNINLNNIFIHVESSREVSIKGVLSKIGRRETYLKSSIRPIFTKEKEYLPVDLFIIELLTAFAVTEDRNKILKIVGNITDQKSIQTSDDGVTQTVTVREGITKCANIEVGYTVQLKPFRTFREIDQPESNFVFRIRPGRDQKPECALFTADGEAWEYEARQRIFEYLDYELAGGTETKFNIIY